VNVILFLGYLIFRGVFAATPIDNRVKVMLK